MRIHVTNHSKGTKMEGIQSISTSVLRNPICQKRRKVCGGICEHCYANALCRFRTSLNKNLSENFDALNSRLMTKAEAAVVPISTVYSRIESFGDVASVTQARNYLRIIKGHRPLRFAIWSKNDGIWHAAFKKEGKPRNCTYVHSSMKVNEVDDIPEWMKPYVDHVFTVWDEDKYAQFAGGETECAGIMCLTCVKCYKRGGPYHINEKLR